MIETKKRLAVDNVKKNNKNHIFGNYKDNVDYHDIKLYEINGMSLEEIINKKDNEIRDLKNELVELKEQLKQELEQYKIELNNIVEEIIKGKVV